MEEDESNKMDTTRPNAQDGKDIQMSVTPAAIEIDVKSTKRRIDELGKAADDDPPKGQKEEDALVPFLEEMLREKNEQMKAMQKTIDVLNERLEKMQATLDRMESQQPREENL